MKLFRREVSLTDTDNDQGEAQSGANEFSWNPFLVKYGVQIQIPSYCRDIIEPNPDSQQYCIKLSREHLRRFDSPNASWKTMFVSHPTRLHLFTCLTRYPVIDTLPDSGYESLEAQKMEFLTDVDRRYTNYSPRYQRDKLIIVAEYR